MSNMINIRGKEISEDTIVEALKKHCGFEEEPLLKAGDIVRNECGEIRIIVDMDFTGKLAAFDINGKMQSKEGNSVWPTYRTIETLNILNPYFKNLSL